MSILISIFKLAAGIGMFLFAMYLIEEALKNLSGRGFKRFLQRTTKSSLGGVASGAVITALLQSSSMVSLMVLAFVGAGVFTLKNALAIILGANLGTLLSSWLVATLGFKVNIEVVAYPAVFTGGMLLILFGKYKVAKYASYFLLGFGLLFTGLAFMKGAMESQVAAFDFARYAQMPLIVFLLIGFCITLLVQSSSVTMALTLTALYAGAIDFLPAAAIALGSETGTTIKIFIAALGGSAAKKRVAAGNILFNIVLTIIAFALIVPLVALVKNVFKISDPLIGLVAFSTVVNVLAILLFLPFLGAFAKFLEKLFNDADGSASAFISSASTAEPQTAIDLFKKETQYFIHNAMLYNLILFDGDTRLFISHPDFGALNAKKKFLSKTPEERYEFIKLQQGELQAFYLALRPRLEAAQSPAVNQLISAVRSAMHAVKSIKDISTNITNLSRSSKDIKYSFFMHHKQETEDLYLRLNDLLSGKTSPGFEVFQQIFTDIQSNYTSALNDFYKDAQHAAIEDMDITTALNFNRELFTSNKAMLMAVKDLLLNEKQAVRFNEIPVYKT